MRRRLLAFATVLTAAALVGCTAAGAGPTAGPDAHPEPTPSASSPAPAPTADPIEAAADELLAKMTLEEKVGQMFIVSTGALETGVRRADANGVENDTETAIDAKQIVDLAKYQPGGVILYAGNVRSRTQLTKYTASLQAHSDVPLWIGSDEEGGIVQRLVPAGVKSYPDMAVIGAAGDPSQACQVGSTLGKQMLALGVNLDFAPVADIATNPKNPIIGPRAFGKTPEVVAPMVAAEVPCLQRYVSATLKHFPGHGDTSTDSHTGLAAVNNGLARLEKVEFVPFEAGIAAGVDLVMTAHIVDKAVEPSGVPATMSKTFITGILRGELGFEGVVTTDALDMAAISRYGTAKIVKGVIGAGVDVLLVPADWFGMYDTLLDDVRSGTISETRIDQSVRRILIAKLRRGVIPMP